MLATNPVDPDMAFRFGTLTSVGAHSHVSPRDEKGLGAALNIVGAAALLVIGYIVGGAATAAGSASVDTPQPVNLGGGPAAISRTVDAPIAGEFRLGPGNDPAPGIVRVTMPEPATGDFRLGPGNGTPPGIAGR
ncbi:MAG TPA: hypothetical protein VFL03_02595 [Candidatus Limnocylindrales bacterium]|jgi:hypothetical protein|nr:hypothetical protein [Candidatus Limnocylindrales bacterium]